MFRFYRENKDIFQELIENRIKVSVELADGSIEETYLTEKGEDYFSFQILNDNENITSEEVITKDYFKKNKKYLIILKEKNTRISKLSLQKMMMNIWHMIYPIMKII